MKISVLIPMYNTEKYIGNCLNSIINQDIAEQDYEIIVIDDGSTDNSAEVVESYMKKAKNIVLHRQSNAGISVTSNGLLKLAKGEYIYKIDSDDYIAHNTLGTLLKIANENNLEVLGFDSCDTTRLDLHELDSEINPNNLKIYSGPEYWANAKNPRLGANWYIMKNAFLIDNNRTFESDISMCDAPFTFQLFSVAERVAYLPSVIHRYVQIAMSESHNSNVNHLRKRVGMRETLVHKFREIIVNLEEKNDPKYLGLIHSLKFWSDVNVYFIFQKLVYVNMPIKHINNILKRLKKIKAYPMKNFTGAHSFSKSHKLLTWFFNHKYLFFMCLYKLRLLVKLKLLKFRFR